MFLKSKSKHTELIFQLIVESSPNAIILVNKEGKIAYVNSQTEKLFGFTKAELIGQLIELLVPARYSEGHPGFRNMFFESPSVRSMGAGRELFALRKDKSEFPIEIGLNPVVTVDGTLVLASIIDITERKKAEDRFKLVVESAPNAMILVNSEGIITLINKQTEIVFGYKREELVGSRLDILVPKRFSNHTYEHRQFFKNLQTRPMGTGLDLFGLRKDGTEIALEIGLNPIETEIGQMVLASIIDITERKKAEERFKLVVESSPYAKLLVNHKGEIIFANTQTEKLFGYEKKELIGNKVEILIPERFHSLHTTHRSKYSEKPDARPMGVGRDLFAIKKNGTEFPVEIGLSPIESYGGIVIVTSIIDISERKKQELAIEKYLTELEKKNKELEQLAYIASHDLQEPLRTISNYMQVFEEDYLAQLDDNARKYLASVNSATKRMSLLVRALLDFSRLGRDNTLTNVDCKALITNVIKDLQSVIDNSGSVIYVGEMPTLNAYEIELGQLLQNLLTNAIKFRRQDTRPEIKIESKEVDEKWHFSVSDNGIGIAPAHFKRIFDIFQRLHHGNNYEGNGIGLANCKKIVDLHQGQIWVESTLGKGSTFNFTIPNLAL